MKLVRKFVDKDGSGSVTLRPEEDEDMWHAYNLIQEVTVPPAFTALWTRGPM
jgi:stalled ribosome rescue protein Dom34